MQPIRPADPRARQGCALRALCVTVDDSLPFFKYHPDPVATRSVEPSDTTCLACGQARGYVYSGPVYAVDELVEQLCPWCIADGSASRLFDAEFTDVGLGVPPDVAADRADELARRTPGFFGWQQEYWLYHCGDAAAFLGRVGYRELQPFPDALEMLLHENERYGWTPEQSAAFVRSLDENGGRTAYLFRCLVCHAHVAYSDAS